MTVAVNSNPASTTFAINETSTGNFVQADGTLGALAVWQDYTTWGGALGQTVSGLTPNTTYTFKVKARNGDSTETAYSSTTSEATLVSVPSAPTIGAPTALSTTLIRWTFVDTSDNETGFVVHDGSNNIVATCATANITTCDETGLSVNTNYSGRHVHAYNDYGNSTASSDASSLYTLANTPNTPTVLTPTTSSLTLVISTTANPANTEYSIYETTTDKYVQANLSLGTSTIWQTYSTWGSSAGATPAVGRGGAFGQGVGSGRGPLGAGLVDPSFSPLAEAVDRWELYRPPG